MPPPLSPFVSGSGICLFCPLSTAAHLLTYGSLRSRQILCSRYPHSFLHRLSPPIQTGDVRLSAYADTALHLSVINRNGLQPTLDPLRWSIAPRITPLAFLPSHPPRLSLSPRQVSRQYRPRSASLHHGGLPIMVVTGISPPPRAGAS